MVIWCCKAILWFPGKNFYNSKSASRKLKNKEKEEEKEKKNRKKKKKNELRTVWTHRWIEIGKTSTVSNCHTRSVNIYSSFTKASSMRTNSAFLFDGVYISVYRHACMCIYMCVCVSLCVSVWLCMCVGGWGVNSDKRSFSDQKIWTVVD